MKNPHGVEPTQFLKRKEERYAIECNSYNGPNFGCGDIYIRDECDKKDNCSINNNDTSTYECHSKYKSSLYLDTNKSISFTYFEMLDYEVFSIDNYKDYIYNNFKQSDILWQLIQKKDCSEDLLKQIDDDTEILNFLDAIHYEDSNIQLKISQYSFKNPSEFLPDTQIISHQYDDKLKEWLGSDYKWKLIYRASEHGYTAKSFHECCDDKGPTLVVIKSSGGWIFGGYTTQSWSGDSIGKRDDKAFIFTLKNPYGVEPTRYIQREDSRCAIGCVPNEGPLFGHVINIHNNCNEEKSCAIDNHLLREYECHPEYEHSLYVNTAEPFSKNPFSVLDYEVFEQN